MNTIIKTIRTDILLISIKIKKNKNIRKIIKKNIYMTWKP